METKSLSCPPFQEVESHLVDGPIPYTPPLSIEGAGAVIQFDGIVRADKHEQKTVSHIFYQVYPIMAGKILRQIHDEIVEKHQLFHLELKHAFGTVKVNETSLFVRAYSKHRKNNFAAVIETVDRIKAEAPFWKQEFYSDQSHAWVKCNH